MGRRWIFGLAAASGCVSIPDSELAVPEKSCGCAVSVRQAVDSGSFTLGEWVRQNWWEQFDDPVLTSLIEQGLKSSPDLMIAKERLKAAAQIALQKKAALYPEIDFDASDYWVHLSKEGFFRAFAPSVPTVVNEFFVGLSLTHEFDFWGKNRDLFRAELGEWAARCAEEMQAELIMASAIAYTYFELQFLLLKQEIIQAQSANRESESQIRQRRRRDALDTALEPLQAQSNVLDYQASLKDLSIDIEAHTHKLKALAGEGQDAELKVVRTDLKSLRLALPETLCLDLIGRRPDLIALKRRLEAAAERVSAAKTDFYPNVNLKAILGMDSVFWSQLFRWGNWNFSAEPALHLPIFTAGRIRAQLYEKVADFNQAVYMYNALIIQAAREIADSLSKIGALLQEMEIRQASLQIARSKEAIVERRFLGALDTRSDFLSAQEEVLRNRLILAQVEYGVQLAEIDLIRSLGGGFCE